MTLGMTTTGKLSRASYDSIIEFDARHYTIDSALLLALSDLYGRDVVLRGRGRWQRFAPLGKHDLDGYAATLSHDVAVLGRWDNGERHLVAVGDNKMNERQQCEHRDRAWQAAEKARRVQQAQRQQEHAQTALRAHELWAKAMPTKDHAYLRRKGVAPGSNRQLGSLMLVPLVDGTRLVNVQTIATDGTKRFLKGGRKQGCYHPIGAFDTDRPLLICEGWATGMTLHAETGLAVACAMDAGNLMPVARYLRSRYPGASIIVACDNDHATVGNPGVTKGRAAAEAVGGRAIWPALDGIEGASDYNDLALLDREVAV